MMLFVNVLEAPCVKNAKILQGSQSIWNPQVAVSLAWKVFLNGQTLNFVK